MGTDERPASEWPDEVERRHWTDVLQAVAERERLKRGVDEPSKITVGYGALWGYYGPIRIRLAGQDAEVRDEAELFDEIDFWAAFERPNGPGKRLDRDRAVMEAWRARLPGLRALWQEAAERVFRDVVTTTHIRWEWRRPTSEVRVGMAAGPTAGGLDVAALRQVAADGVEEALGVPLASEVADRLWPARVLPPPGAIPPVGPLVDARQRPSSLCVRALAGQRHFGAVHAEWRR